MKRVFSEPKWSWWRWKEGASSGWRKDWSYTYSSAQNIHQLEEELDSRYHLLSTWSEHYRGIKGNRVPKLPLLEFQTQMKTAEMDLQAAISWMEQMQIFGKRWFGKSKEKRHG